MIPAPDLESQRLATIAQAGLDTPGLEPDLDAIAALAATITGCPMATIGIIGRTTSWAKAAHNVASLVSPREESVSAAVIAAGTLIAVPDALADPRFAAYPAVTGEAGVRAGAGVPLSIEGPDGQRLPIGALVVLDRTVRPFTPEHCAALERLREVADALIAARHAAGAARAAQGEAEAATRRYRRQDRLFRQAERMASVGYWRYRIAEAQVEWSDEVFRIHGLAPGNLPDIGRALDFYPPHARALVSDALARAIEDGAPFDLESDFVTAKGEHRRVRSVGEVEMEQGRVSAIIGVFQDVTERYRLEQNLRDSANIDEVTRIANRAAFNRALESAMAKARERSTPLLLAVIDLDHFKAINDTHGHLVGDDVLRVVGARLGQPWMKNSFAARLGGDEFALIVEDARLTADAGSLVTRLADTLGVPAMTAVGAIDMSATIGTATLNADTLTTRDLIHAADTALYAGKRARIAPPRQRRVANG